MKKTKIIAIVLAAAVMLMGAGYAYWSDTLIINNTVSTGELNVEFTTPSCMPIYPLILDVDDVGETRYIQSTISQNRKSATVVVEDMYPGSIALYALKADNLGTIPAVINDVEVNFTQESIPMNTYLKVAGGFMHFNVDNEYKGGNFFCGTLAELEANLNTILNTLRMEPGDYILFDIPEEYQDEVQAEIPTYNPDDQNCIVFYVPTTVDNSHDMENQTAVFDIELNFVQHNAQ